MFQFSYNLDWVLITNKFQNNFIKICCNFRQSNEELKCYNKSLENLNWVSYNIRKKSQKEYRITETVQWAATRNRKQFSILYQIQCGTCHLGVGGQALKSHKSAAACKFERSRQSLIDQLVPQHKLDSATRHWESILYIRAFLLEWRQQHAAGKHLERGLDVSATTSRGLISPRVYLIRKSLFSTQKIAQKSNSGSSASVGSSSNNLNINSGSDLASKVVFADSYRFYCNKNANDMRRQVAADTGTTSATSLPAGRTSVSSQNFNAVSASTPTNSIKKCFSISDILRFHLIFNNSNDLFFLNYIDYIEESCAKSYINGVIHYLGLNATQNDWPQRANSRPFNSLKWNRSISCSRSVARLNLSISTSPTI